MGQNDEKLLLARLADIERMAEHGKGPCFSRFLDPKELAVFKRQMRPNCQYMLWGGYQDAERQVLGFFPDYLEPEEEHFPLVALRLLSREELGHRAILGSVMSLGIERNLIGDIAMEEQGAVLFACDTICDYLQMNLARIGRAGIKTEVVPAHELRLQPKAWEPISGTVASLRLDCVLGLLTGLSRGKTEEMLQKELVMVNYSVCAKGSVPLLEGDVLSVRGFGRAELLEISGETRKGRTWITLKKYV